MKLEELVPNIKLCELIPEGEFADSAFMWLEVEIPQENKKEWNIVNRTRPIEFCHNLKYPAPTLEEIMAKFPHCACVIGYLGWSAASYYIGNNLPKFASNGVTAALKLWLKMKGIDYGK